MPLIAHTDLPTFARLADDGQEILDASVARHQDIRELHVGILNLMPDAALQATERQFLRMLGASNRIVQLYAHLFTVDGLERSDKALSHIERHYDTFESIKKEGLDALIITGANVTQPDLTKEAFYPQMCEVFEWARENVASILCSCLASHALWQHEYGLKRKHLGVKRWGVFKHQVRLNDHPLVSNINTRFDAPHSRFNDVAAADLTKAGAHVLITSEHGEALLAVSDDGLSAVYLQGHPEYDALSLAKEYKREVMLFMTGDHEHYPPFPDHYFTIRAMAILDEYQRNAEQTRREKVVPPDFPDAEIIAQVDNTWGDTGKAIFNNWLGLIYQTTNVDRHQRFMDGVDADDPTGWLAKN